MTQPTPPLGLPLEYQQMPEYFDAHNVNAETEAKNALIEGLLKEQGVQSVLDLTCGTGSQVFFLDERGYEVVGADFSPALIQRAREKAKEKGRKIQFLDGDMRNLVVGQHDAVITIFNAIGHVSRSDFEKTLHNIARNLKEGGIYIFDIFNLQAMTDEVIDGFSMDITSTVGDDTIHHTQDSKIDREKRLLTSCDKYTIDKKGSEPVKCINRFSLQIYTKKELDAMLSRNGFEVIKQLDMDGNPFVPEKSLSILTVARKR